MKTMKYPQLSFNTFCVGLCVLFVAIQLQCTNESAVKVTEFGAVPNDGNDDTKAIEEALNSGKDVLFPDGVYHIESDLVLSSESFKDKKIYAENHKGATLRGSGDVQLICHYFHKIENLVFDNVGVEVLGGRTRNNSRYIESNEFINLQQKVPCILLEGSEGPISNLHINNNRFSGGLHAVFGDISNSTIENNYSKDCKRNYIFRGFCENVIIHGNEMHGGMVGIGFFCTKGSGNSKFGNIVEHNQCIDQSEEGISFDMFGNEERSYTRWSGSVTDYESSNGKVIRLYLDSEPEEDLTDHSVVFLDDNKEIKGCFSSISMAGIDENRAFLDLRSGPDTTFMYDHARIVVLAFVPRHNRFRYNTAERAGKTGIFLHGAGFHTLIEHNKVIDCNHEIPNRYKFWGGISVRNMHITLTPGEHGPVYFNTVRYNTASGEKSTINAYDPWTGKTPKSIGNKFYENRFLNGAILDTLENINEPANRPLPRITITSPADSASFKSGETFTLSADPENFKVDSVTLLIDGERETADMSAPYEFQVSPEKIKSSIVQVVGTGSSGDTRVADHIAILVN